MCPSARFCSTKPWRCDVRFGLLPVLLIWDSDHLRLSTPVDICNCEFVLIQEVPAECQMQGFMLPFDRPGLPMGDIRLYVFGTLL